ncbi:hypothetical protein [Streptomyces sp. NPDC101165]|uniref:hypothetical protein n=1 Tax=Streptomyces sp. NPDC101165 TaxID=3366119 RepID=UPI0038036174
MKKSLAALAVVGVAAASLVTTAPAASAAGCVTSGITTGYQGPGSVAYKAASGCRDLNLTYSYDSAGTGWDSYAGYYKNSSGTWTRGSRGYTGLLSDGAYSLGSIVLVSDLTSGRAFSVASDYNGGDWVVITH